MDRKTKLMNKIGAFRDDIDFLCRKDISGLFKFLNMLSGDRLRNNLVFANMSARNLKKEYDRLMEFARDYPEEMTAERWERYVDLLEFDINRVIQDVEDLWTL